MSADPIRLAARPDGVAVLTFDQPGSRANVLTADLWAAFEAALDSLPTSTAGLVLASAKPGIFIAGADLHLLQNAPGPDDPGVRAFIAAGLRTLAKLERLPVPTAAAIDGAALGGGLEVALACDLRVCGTGEKVKLGLPETTLGLIPGWGGTQRLPRLIGAAAAVGMLADGQPVGANEALLAGLADEIADSADLIDVAAERVRAAADWRSARQLRQGRLAIPDAVTMSGEWSTNPAVKAATELVTRGAELPLAEAIALETAAFLRLAGSAEAKAKIAAFFAGRKKV